MDAILKDLDWRARAGMWASLALVGVGMLWFSARSLMVGPWFLAVAAAVFAAIALQASWRSYPEKLPSSLDKLKERIDKWKSLRSRATASARGRFVWNLGRGLAGSMAVWHLLGLVDGMSGSVRWIATLGGGLSYGFFGIEAAIWSGIAVGLVAQGATHLWLQTDFSEPVSRNAFMTAWGTGALRLSWLWVISMLLAAPLWVGIAATIGIVKERMGQERAQRVAAAADRKRIEARRKRQRERAGKSEADPLAEAKARLAEAEAKVGAIRAGKSGGGTQVATELRGAEKLEHDRMVEMLRRYGEQVRTIRDIEKDGLEPDPNMLAMQRGFDRVLMGLGDPFVELMRADTSPGGQMLLAYYDDLCAIEARAMRGGDGEVVTSSVEYERYGDEGGEYDADGSPEGRASSIEDEEDEIDAAEVHGGFERRQPVPEFDDVEEDMDLDVLDGGSNVSNRLAGLAAGLGEIETRPVPPPASDDEEPVLPVEDDVSTEQTFSQHSEEVLPGEIDETEAPVAVDQSASVPVPEDVSFPDPAFGRDDTFFAEGEGDAPPSDDYASSDDGEEDDPVDDEAMGAGDASRGDDGDDAGVREPLADDGERVQSGGDEDHAPGTGEGDEMIEGGPDASALRNAAVQILMRKTPREMVVSTSGWFRDAGHAAAVMGIDRDMYDEVFVEYAAKVAAHADEVELSRILEESPGIEVLGEALKRLEAHGWEHDETVVASAKSWIEAEQERLAAVAAAEALRIEQERIAAEAAENARLEKERIEREAEEARVAAEAARVAEQEAAEQRAREEALFAESERERLADLERRRKRVGLMLIVGRIDEETLTAASELFSSEEELATSMDLEVDTVSSAYNAFAVMRDARMKYMELAEALRNEDVSVVEALIADRSSFEGYQHPKIDLDEAKRWADGIRARERMQGIIEVDTISMRVPDTGGESGRMFMMKRTKISPEIADIVNDKLPKGMKAAKSISETMDFLGGDAATQMAPLLASTRQQVARYAAQVVAAHQGKVNAREYASAFLPEDCRTPGVDVWDTLVGLAATVVPDEPVAPPPPAPTPVPAPAPTPAPAPAEEAPKPERQTPPAKAEPERRQSSPGRIRPAQPVSFEMHKSPEQVQAMDYKAHVEAIPKKAVDQAATANQIRLSLREIYGSDIDDHVRVEGVNMYADALAEGGRVLGQIRIFMPAVCPVWYVHARTGIVFKDPITGDTKQSQSSVIEREINNNLNTPNGDPETVIGVALLSHLITPEGVISFQPMFRDKFGGRATIIQISDADGLREFISRIVSM